MKNVQKTFTVKFHTTNTNIDKEVMAELVEKAISESEYAKDITFEVEDHVGLLFNFLEDTMTFSFFIRKTKEDFLKEYPYLAEEYDFCLSEFNKNTTNALLTFLENTSTPKLTEPYGLSPEDFSFSVGMYIKNNMTPEEQINFLKEVASRGLKVDM